jgi:hypothetical protein
MKTLIFKRNYDLPGLRRVEIENEMAPLAISASETGELQIEAELRVMDKVSEPDLDEYFHIEQRDDHVEIELEEIQEIAEPFFGSGKSQVNIHIPKGVALVASAEVQPLVAEGLQGSLVLHNENGPIKLGNCDGHIHLKNENGPIKLNECSAEFEIELENGPLSAEKLSGPSLEIESENGPVKLRAAAFPKVRITNENGVIYYETLPVENGDLSFVNENGIIHLVVPETLEFELDAETNVGTISTNLEGSKSVKDGHMTFKRGEGGTKISVRTENGVIKLGSDGASDLSFIKLKLKDLKGSIGAAVGPDDMEKVQKAMETATAAVEKALGSIHEEKIKEKIALAMDKMKQAVENFEFKETTDKVIKTVDQIGDEVNETLKNVLRKVKEPSEERNWERHKHQHFAGDSLKEYIDKVIDAAVAKVGQGKGMSGSEKQAVDERSRSKILEMLESGKITAEEAERLLKAIGRE